MKLAMINSDVSASCFLCGWGMKSPSRRRNSRLGKEVELTIEERLKILEQNIVTHLRFAHDRMMLTKEVVIPKEKELGQVNKIIYSGRAVGRIKWTTMNLRK